MEDDTSNDVEAVEFIESQGDNDSEKRPIMLLLKRLIRNKQNTVMTNTQIIEILQLEFNIEISNCHELEVDIYIKIIKKYLKDWPQWEELERISSKLSNVKDFDAVAKVLNHKYKNLKEYLGVMLEAAKPLTKKAVRELAIDLNKGQNVDSSEVVMEVYCTREQLNHLFFRKPRADLNNAIFNINKIEPTKISLNTLTFESILNFWWTKIYIQLPNFTYFRELIYKYKHTLVNKVRDEKTPAEILDTRVYNKAKKVKEHPKTAVYQYFDKILQLCNDEHVVQLLQVIFHVLKTDLIDLPDTVKIPSNYRKHVNQYNYVRYLYVENEESDDTKYDLQLEEVVTPSYQILIGRLGKMPESLPPVQEWLKIECMMCKAKFMGTTELMSLLQAHFNDCHQHEPDWQCPHCKRLFSMDYLSKNRWCHEC
ncbi:unnamed protein product [Arctia plantaginis]|uniref:C2H2-type domain-containing protein n=1 Tax=Arctia plantaginis TaxID=874455 RepID=A0A8S0ZFV4_ARCPL|nr:unnamed protein product [Arctia plantaginis]CAB3232208.1 unnamed protein product [Arctia plantaginis]